jgi:hypothetical protein
MNAMSFMYGLEQRGMRIWVDSDGDLRITHPELLTDADESVIRLHHDELKKTARAIQDLSAIESELKRRKMQTM